MAKDILLDTDGDVFVSETGIKHTNEAEPQLMQRLMEANTGTLRYAPMVGAGVKRLPNGRINQDAIKKINVQLDADGWTEAEVLTDGKNIEIYANHT